MSWSYKNTEFHDIPVGYESFIYIITNLETNKKYIGKKQFYFKKTKQVNKKKKKYKIASDWLDYYGSNDDLLTDVAKLGKDKFKREILYLCKNLSQATYLESREQFDRRVLESEDYYNQWIMCRTRKSNIFNKLD